MILLATLLITNENGVSRALVLDYNDFAISGEFTSIELRNSGPCR
jgi:hypothetical protein